MWVVEREQNITALSGPIPLMGVTIKNLPTLTELCIFKTHFRSMQGVNFAHLLTCVGEEFHVEP